MIATRPTGAEHRVREIRIYSSLNQFGRPVNYLELTSIEQSTNGWSAKTSLPIWLLNYDGKIRGRIRFRSCHSGRELICTN